MSQVLRMRPWGNDVINDAATSRPRESEESFQGPRVMLTL